MESRNWQRRNIGFDVEVRLWHKDGEQVVNCKTRDISMGGAFLLTNELGYPKHRLLNIQFPALKRLALDKPNIIARATRKEDEGIAICFSKAERETIRAMHKMLQWRSYYPLEKQQKEPEKQEEQVESKSRRYLNPAPLTRH